MIEEPIRQATEEEILLLLRDRQDELRLLIGEPLAVFSMPVASWKRILVTLPYPPPQDDAPVFMTINERTVCVPIQMADAQYPVQCDPLFNPRKGDADTRLAALINHRLLYAAN